MFACLACDLWGIVEDMVLWIGVTVHSRRFVFGLIFVVLFDLC